MTLMSEIGGLNNKQGLGLVDLSTLYGPSHLV